MAPSASFTHSTKMLARQLGRHGAAVELRLSPCTEDVCATYRRSFHAITPCLSGHNKWSKIKHTKEKNDSKRGTSYSNLSQEIIAAVRNHPTRSTSTDTNPKLGLLLRKAKAMDVPRDKVEATLKKAEAMGTASADGQSVTYEALGPTADNGQPVALIVECQTDSPGRTHARVKEAFNKSGIRLSSTEHMFQRTGIIRLLAREGVSFDGVFDVALENGAEDVREWEASDDDRQNVEATTDEQGSTIGVEVTCNPSDVLSLTSILAAEPHHHSVVESATMMIPVGPPILIRGIHDLDKGEESTKDGDEVEPAGWLNDESMAKLNKAIDMLYENADCTRVW